MRFIIKYDIDFQIKAFYMLKQWFCDFSDIFNQKSLILNFARKKGQRTVEETFP